MTTVPVPPLLEVRDLRLDLAMTKGLQRRILRGVSFELRAGEALGVVGESGSGKSMTARAITRLLPNNATVHGRITFNGASVLDMSGSQLRRLRSQSIAMIFQDPRAHINPVRTVGDFLCEGLISTRHTSRRVAEATVRQLLADVQIPDADRRMRQRPYELSGGLLQRVMIAAALAIEPALLIADEPTTALDVTTQEEVMAILAELCRVRSLALLFITHDLELAGAVCDRTAVMYAGRVVESAPTRQLHADPRHPYTQALLAAQPAKAERGSRLPTVAGAPISAWEVGDGCSFQPRCPIASQACRTDDPRTREVLGSDVACHHAEQSKGAVA
ncbi:ABC transporter ATP-binding protein [Jatrophihabitans telluris]|uniref:ABC transporter ATP-binding protein n=1 Tax=Jatrophihabitans telluris TaxID=2038343 RepID=A0ABY4QZB1_9ACTN|nr:ABC transporter ATP-binding protein [Jatrophihabitans telluris]UQX89006.1 ABC transporter ATP-binding protein [Jatrophihabitans telluris]